MTQINFGICFSKDFVGNDPLGHIGIKLPVYLRFLEFCKDEGWGVYVLTRKTYKGNSVFNGAWIFNKEKFINISRQNRKKERTVFRTHF